MRASVLCAALVLGGCFGPPPTGYPPSSPSGPPVSGGPPSVGDGMTWTLVLDAASVQDLGYGVPPDVFVVALVGGTQVTSPDVYGTFDAVWDQPLLDADAAALAGGIDLQVWADYGGGPTLAGEISYEPVPSDFGAGPLDLGAFDYVDDLQIELQPG